MNILHVSQVELVFLYIYIAIVGKQLMIWLNKLYCEDGFCHLIYILSRSSTAFLTVAIQLKK